MVGPGALALPRRANGAAPGRRPGTTIAEGDAEFTPHLDACFLVVEEPERIVFTTAVDSGWRPATGPIPMTAEIVLLDHPEGTDYRVLIRHGDPSARARHEELGFAEGWGTVSGQLANLVEREAVA